MLAAALGGAWWFLYRPLPQVSGSLRAPVSAAATVVRDSLGVPHIEAGSVEDAVFLQGFATAQDRLWQMDALRRLAAGELAEVVGKRALESDQDSRRLRLRRLAEMHERTLPAADKALLAAYARGVNYFLETHRGKLSFEFALLGYDPRPWTVKDSLLAALQMYRNLTTSWRDDAAKRALLSKAKDPAKIDLLFPARAGWEPQPGSNAWALSGTRTVSGKPILANDPHLEFSLPATWHQVHLKAAGLNVTGVALPGLPGVIIGHNERIGWGVTNLHFDVQDLYEERIDLNSGQYVFRGQLKQAQLEVDPIAIKGEKPFDYRHWVTGHGPIFYRDGDHLFSLRWTAAEPGTFEFPFLDINRAGNWPEFVAAIKRFPGPGQNFVYADVDGNIGYHATGRLPIRRGFSGAVPADGSSGDFEWAGFIPFEELPAVFNPPSGRVVTANQNPFPPGYAYGVNGSFASPYRAVQIAALLDAAPKWQPQGMLAVQKDVYSASMAFLAGQLVAAVDRKKPSSKGVQDCASVLRNWDGQMDKDAAAPVAVSLAYLHLRRLVAEAAAPGKGPEYEFNIAAAAVEKLLRERPAGWVKDWDDTLIASLSAAFEEAAKPQGSRVDRWLYGKLNTLTVAHPIGSQLPLIGTYFNVGPLPMSGGSTTVKQTTRRMGPSMRLVVDFSDLDASLNNITIGESGHPLSGHYKDQWDAYYYGRGLRMPFRNVEPKSTLRVSPAP